MEAPLTTILLVDGDERVASSVRSALAGAAELIVVKDDTAAREALTASQVDVMLVDAAQEASGDASLIELAQSGPRRVSTILMMAAPTAREAEAALDRGVASILDKPFSDADLARALERALTGESFRGHLTGVSMLDLFQVFNLSRRSLVAQVGGVPPARVWFENGEIVHAECGDQRGERVLEQLVDVRAGALRTLPFTPPPRTIDRLFHSLLLDILRARDEADNGAVAPEDDRAWELSDSDFSGPTDPAAHRGERIARLERLAAERLEVASLEVAPAPRPHDAVCEALVAELPSAIAVALIDLATGQLVGMHNTAPFTPPFERFVSLYVRELFRGPEIQYIERTMQARRGMTSTSGFLEEVLLTSRYTRHLIKSIKDGRVALMVVVPRRVSIIQLWPRIRELIPGIESNLD